MNRKSRITSDSKVQPIVTIIKCLIGACVLTGILLLGLAFILYQFGMTAKMVSVAMIILYVSVTFVTGLLTGKMMESRKFLWGLLAGAAYFGILLVISLAVGEKGAGSAGNIITTACLCAGGGMLGGMVS